MEDDFAPVITVIIGIKVLVALPIYAIGRWFAGWSSNWVRHSLERRETDEAVARMAATLTGLAVLLIAIVVAWNMVGNLTTALAALVAARGLAVLQLGSRFREPSPTLPAAYSYSPFTGSESVIRCRLPA